VLSVLFRRAHSFNRQPVFVNADFKRRTINPWQINRNRVFGLVLIDVSQRLPVCALKL
jgi:hypothetical protein